MRWRVISVFVAIIDAKLPRGTAGQQDGNPAFASYRRMVFALDSIADAY